MMYWDYPPNIRSKTSQTKPGTLNSLLKPIKTKETAYYYSQTDLLQETNIGNQKLPKMNPKRSRIILYPQ